MFWPTHAVARMVGTHWPVVPAVGIWSPCGIRGCERRRASAPRSGYALDCRRQSGAEELGFAESDGALRDAMARGAQELRCSCRPSGRWIDLVHGRRPPRGIVLDMDSSVSPTHGEQESVWNGHYACTCYHPLFVFNQFGDLERCARVPATAQPRRLGRRAQARRGALPGQGLTHLFSSGRGLCNARGLPVAPVACQFQLSGPNLDQAAEDYRQGRVASRRTLSPRRLHRDEYERPGRARRCFLQQARDVRAMDQGGQRRDQVDATVVPNVCRQRGAAPASCARLQPRQFPAHAGDAGADQDRREGSEPRPLCYLPDGRGRHPTANVPGDFAAHRGTAAAATTSASVRRSMVVRSRPTNRRSASLCQEKSPDETLAVTPDGSTVYVANQGANTVSVIATASNTVTATIAVGSVPLGVAASPDGSTVYVTNFQDNTVSVIATASNKVLAVIPVGSSTPPPEGGGPNGVAVSPDGSTVYVANFIDGTVSVIATARDTVTATIPVGSGPLGVAVTPDGSRVYVTNFQDNTVSVIATASNTVTAM